MSAFINCSSSPNLTTGLANATFQLSGSIEILVNYIATLAWLSATLRRSSFEGISVSTVSIVKAESLTDVAFKLTQKALRADSKDQWSCWHGLFRHNVVAFGFEIATRQHDIGLKLTLELMIELAKNAKPLNYAGRFILIDLHSALISVSIFNDHSIQWHLFISSNPDEIILQDLSKASALSVPATCKNDLDIRIFFQALKNRRHFCEWCRNARITLDACPREEDNYIIRGFTNTPEILNRAKFAFFNVEIAFSGLGFAGPSFSGTWTITTTRKNFSELSMQRFESMLSTARRMLSILYDPDKKRAWMVPVICVLYHMTHLRVMMDGHNIYLSYVKSSWDGASAAYNAIISNRQIIIGPQDFRYPYLLSDLLEQLWVNLQQVKMKQSSRKRWSRKNSLRGCELMNIVNDVPSFRLKRTYVHDNDGWIKLLREIEVVLFCNDIDDVIISKDSHTDTCRLWPSVPAGQDFLCVTIDCLKRLSDRAGSSRAYESLAHDCFWHSPAPLFDSCSCRDYDSCKLLQRVVKDTTLDMFGMNKIQSLNNIVAEGAIIFGGKAKNWSLQQSVQSQAATSENEPGIFQVRHFQLDKEPSSIQNLHSVFRMQGQPRLHRCVKSENLRFSIGQSIYAHQHQ